MICNSLGLYVMCLFFSYFLKRLGFQRWSLSNTNFIVHIYSCLCMSSLLLSCWRSSWCLVFGCLCQGFSLHISCLVLKHVLLAISLLWVSMFHGVMLTWLFRSFNLFLLLMFKNKNKECVDLLTLGWSEAVTMCIVCGPLYVYLSLCSYEFEVALKSSKN